MAYSVAVGQGWVSRSDFWSMPPGEFWWLVASKIPDIEKKAAPDMAEVRLMVKAAQAEEARRNG